MLAWVVTLAGLAVICRGKVGNQIVGHHVESWSFEPTSEAPDYVENAMNGTAELTFTAGDFTFELTLQLFTDLYAKNAKIYGGDEHGNAFELPKRHWSYHGTAHIKHRDDQENIGDKKEQEIEIDSNVASVTFYDSMRFRALIITKTAHFTVDLEYLNDEFSLSSLNSNLVCLFVVGFF